MNTAQAEPANVAARASTDFARMRVYKVTTVAHAHLELPASFTSGCGFLCHSSLLPFLERHSQQLEQASPFLVGFGAGDDGDFHAPHLVDLVVLNFREGQLLAQ